MGNEPRKRMRRVGMWKVRRWIDAGMQRVGYWGRRAYWGRRWAYRNCRERLSASVARAVANGSQRLGLGLGSDCRKWFCRSSREWFATIGFAFGFRPSRMVLPEPSRMVRNDWVRTVANGFARVVTNGSQRLGWVWVRTVANGFARDVANGSQRLGIGDGVGSYRWRFGSYRWQTRFLSAMVWTKLDSERGVVLEK